MRSKSFAAGNERLDDALVAFVAVEPGDETVLDEVAEDLINFMKYSDAKVLVIYPHSKLSPMPENYHEAMKKIRELVDLLQRKGVPVKEVEAGAKGFVLETLGVPALHEFRSYGPRKRLQTVAEYVVNPEGEFKGIEECEDASLVSLIKFMKGGQKVEHDPNVERFCRKFGFAEAEVTPRGFWTLLPHAYFMYLAFTVHVTSVLQALEVPTISVKTPEVVRYGCDISCSDGFLRCDEFKEHKQVVEKYADPNDLPFALFEQLLLFREEEDTFPCYRTKEFHVPKVRIFVPSFSEASDVALTLHELIHTEAEKLGMKYVVSYTVSEELFEEAKDLIIKLVKRDNRCAYLRVVKSNEIFIDAEMYVINSMGYPVELGTWKMRKALMWGREVYSVSAAPLGSFERFAYVIFDKAAKDLKSGETPELPAWLSPIQVRVIPKSRDVLPYALTVAEELRERGIRVDVDDRNVPLSRKLKDAGEEWVPFLLLIDKREEKLGRVILMRRKTNDREDVSLEEVIRVVSEEVGGYPQLPQTLPILYSKRPKFAKPDED